MRLLITQVFFYYDTPQFRKTQLVRVPIRLGEDAFIKGEISEEKTARLIEAIASFKHLILAYRAIDYKACATSAMRDAKNGKEVLEHIEKKTGIKIEIIDGKEEAETIFSNHIEEQLDKKNNYLYVDVGGGSTELTLISKNQRITSQSFNVGTIRLLHDQVKKEYWETFKDWVKKETQGFLPLTGIGSGGNINKLYKFSGKKEKYLSYKKLKELSTTLNEYSYEERMHHLDMKPDRADVIIPACKIYLSVMKWAGIENMLVPQFGLSDGIIHELYEKYAHIISSKS